ncbi:glycosyltransferase [Ornithinimicrobium sp. Arc0846-15]|nr:glycosyltransferase [Ornithinimicrobium laminariae]
MKIKMPKARGTKEDSLQGGSKRAGVYFPEIQARGGAERLALLLALELEKAGWDTFFLTDCDVDPAQLSRDLGADLTGIKFVKLRRLNYSMIRLSEIRRLATDSSFVRQIRGLDFDLFVNAQYKSSLPGCARRNVYYCHFPHRLSNVSNSLQHRAYMGFARIADKILVRRGSASFPATYDEIWANSEFTASHVEERWGRSALTVYPPCESIEPCNKSKTIAVIGRFQAPGDSIPYKAQDVLLDTFSAMTQLQSEGWRLVMVGGSSREGANYLLRLLDDANHLPVDIIADASREQLRQVVGEAAIYWHAQGVGGDKVHHPETQEHFGISTVEAMSAGAIPLVYATAGPAEVVSGVSDLAGWETIEGLKEITTYWAHATSTSIEDMRDKCRARAEQFDEAHFSDRVQRLL